MLPDRDTSDLSVNFIAEAPALVAWLRLRGAATPGAGADLEDIAQEVWTRAVQHAARFDPARCAFRTWLIGIAANVLLEHRRGQLRRRRVQIDQGHSSVLQRREQTPAELTSLTGRIVRDEAMQLLLTALDRRDELDRRMFTLRGLEQRPHAETARLLGISVDAAEKRWQRLRDELRTALERVGLDAP